MIGPQRRHTRGRKKNSGSAALHVLGDGWTQMYGFHSTLGPFDMDPAPDDLPAMHPVRYAAVAIESIMRRPR